MTNPLTALCRQLGVGIQDVASIADIDPDMATQLVSGSPPVEIDAFLRVMSALGIRLRVAPSPPLALWFDAAYLDALCFDNAFREKVGLLPLPSTTMEVRDLVLRLAKDNGPTAVCKMLEDSIIPTSTGVRHWNRGSVPQYQRMELKNDTPLERPAWLAPAWRQWVTDQLVGAWCRYDPVAFVRYRFSWQQREELLVARSEDRIPTVARTWIIESLQGVEWLTGRWGVVD